MDAGGRDGAVPDDGGTLADAPVPDSGADAARLSVPCGPCEADSDCAVGMRCVQLAAAGNPTRCLLFVEAGGSCPRPYQREATTDSTSGVPGNYCFPTASASCEAILAAGSSCAGAAECPADAVCATFDPPSCTYACVADYDCPADYLCNASHVCEPL